ncbi:MAG: hypothetical protein IKW39_01775 [Alphaproteobacteria bacterium]|nr:hypothetical protein [Alphaproteobacteria bacterium]
MSEKLNTSMLKAIKSFLLGKKDSDISPSEAEKIQKASYTLNTTEFKKHFSPTYLSIIQGLDSSDRQVFEATVYYLTQIAIKKNKYKNDIIKIMEDKLLSKSLSPEFKEYLKQYMQKMLVKTTNK